MINSTEQYKTSIVGASRRIYIKAVVDISDPDMVFMEPVASSTAPWTKPDEIHDKVMDAPARYATLEPGRWLLDGSFDIFHDNYQVPESMGYALDVLSGDDGSFAEPQEITQPIENVSVLQAFSLYFSNDVVDGVPVDFVVEIVQGETAYFRKEVTGNTEVSISFDGFTVYDPDYIKVTVTKWSLPGRRARFVEIIPGVYEEWTDKVLASFSTTQQADFSCITLPYGTLKLGINNVTKRFEPRKKNSLFQSIEARQGIQAMIGVRLPSGSVEYKPLGTFYQYGDGWKTSDNGMAMNWDLVDIIGLLADRTYFPPDTLPTTLDGWMASVVSQLGDAFKNRYHVDPDYSSKPVTASSKNDVTGKKCGDIIRWACMATGTWPRADAETGYLTAEPLWNQGNKTLLTALVGYPTMKANESVASLIFNLADGNNTQYVVSGNSTSSEKTITIENPFIHTTAEALTAARLILSCYGGNVIETTGRGDPSSELGDVDTIWLDASSATTARRKVQSFSISNHVLQGCGSTLLQADGSYLFQEFAVITESGKWKAPANVKNNQIRVVIGSGGQGGSRGQDGFVGGSGLPGSDVSAGDGANGIDGIGGKVWYGVININPEQEFDVVLGEGGEVSDTYGVHGEMGGVTTFGAYSSENGELYTGGYTDIANGQVFARTGVEKPLDGTGDGGAGGKGGEAGSGYWEQKYWTQGDVDEGRHPGGSLNGKPVPGGTPGSESIVGKPKGWDFIITKEPGPGKPGVAGAKGFVMVTWDKEDA